MYNLEKIPRDAVIITDLDGTLSDPTHRLHHIKGGSKNWRQFFLDSKDDTPNWPIIHLQRMLYEAIYKASPEDESHRLCLYIFSGRSNIARGTTQTWLRQHGVPYDELWMRSEGDFTPDHILKGQWLDALGASRVLFTIDDRQSVVNMWREAGITALQCAPGDF